MNARFEYKEIMENEHVQFKIILRGSDEQRAQMQATDNAVEIQNTTLMLIVSVVCWQRTAVNRSTNMKFIVITLRKVTLIEKDDEKNKNIREKFVLLTQQKCQHIYSP